MNTEITYLYSDADNNKRWATVVVAGELQFKDLKAYLQEGLFFIPGQVELDSMNGYDAISDHPYHQLTEGNIKRTENRPTEDITAQELIKSFERAYTEGWDEDYFNSTLAARLENERIIRIPESVKMNRPVTVRLQSDHHGREDFVQSSWPEALETLFRLFVKVEQLDDGIERTIGVVVNPSASV